MIDKLMQALAPRGVFGFLLRLAVLTGIVALANFAFSKIVSDHSHPPSYYLAHALFVGSPLICFFLAVTVFQVRLQRRLWRLARKDPLTGLNNRRSFLDLVAKIRAEDGRGVLLLLDADHFKSVNDTHGHLTGDRCLKAVALAIRRAVRKEDVVGRIGGEEFAVYLRATTKTQAEMIGARLINPITYRNDEDLLQTITLSIGGVVATHGEDLDAIFSRADKALYDAKLEGRARMIFAFAA